MELTEKVFQNHYGWIETGRWVRIQGGLHEFQNHYGWIETNKGKVEVLLYKQFQNHYGWIETTQSAPLTNFCI